MFEGGEMVSPTTPLTRSDMPAGRHRRPDFCRANGPLCQIQQRYNRQRDQPEIGLHGARRRPGCYRLHRAYAYGNLALDLLLKGIHGRLVVLRNGRYDNMPVDVVTSTKKVVNVNRYYNRERLRPNLKASR